MPRRTRNRLRWGRRRPHHRPPHPRAGRPAFDAAGRAVVRDRPRPRAGRGRLSTIAAVLARHRGIRRRSVLDRRRRSLSPINPLGRFSTRPTSTKYCEPLAFPSGDEAVTFTKAATPHKHQEAPMLDKSPRPTAVNVPNDLAAHWMPFTANRAFKKAPRLLAGAKDMHYITVDGRKIIDAAAGMWCCNAGHGRTQISAAIAKQAETLDYAPPFQFGIPQAFELASRIAELAPAGLDHVFFCNSGSEAADTALKIALAYHQINGQGTRTRLIGRERGYHGVGFGGTSVGGIVNNRKIYGSLLAGVDHLPHTYDRDKQAFTKGEPEYGAHLADELERLVNLHGASTIAAVIVEPMAGSTGVLPAPKGYLKRLREITQKHGILLIFDEVITGFGRLGYAFAAERYGVLPDMLT